ncbi:hypothetical protein CEW92_03130 [Bacillaceae bacterium SAS-127]|nr:hypothetical protein CEW92_03130 [Bacillaceae bacterium SAS-127]
MSESLAVSAWSWTKLNMEADTMSRTMTSLVGLGAGMAVMAMINRNNSTFGGRMLKRMKKMF